ncbi:MAG: hypothetical protein Q8N00_12840 [Nitrospirota bacterium]|nr:hypothetical protein [Nitrospirota bacterium]MDP3596894.1 hypothetical protein [Nitrospirota bacterium]
MNDGTGFLTGTGGEDLDDEAETVLTAGFFSAGLDAAAERFGAAFLAVFIVTFFAADFFTAFLAAGFALGLVLALAVAFAGAFFADCFFFTIEILLSHPVDV